MKKLPTALDGAEDQLQGLADDRAAAGGDGAGAGQVMRWRGRRRPASDGAAFRLAEIEEAGIDAVLLQEGFDVDELRFDRVAQHRGLLGDGGAAEEDDTRQHRRQRQADDGQPQRMRQLHHAAEQVGHGVEGDAEQHAGKDQEQRRGESPGEQQQGCEQHDADAADRDRPRQIVAGLKPIVSRICHVDSFPQNIRRPLFRQNAAGIKRRAARRFDAGVLRCAKRCLQRKATVGEDEMNFKWFGPVALLAALVYRRSDPDQPARPQISADGRGRDARRGQIGLRRRGRASGPQL